MPEQTPQELARAILAPLEHDDWQTRSQKSVEMVRAAPVLARAVQEQAKEIERLRALKDRLAEHLEDSGRMFDTALARLEERDNPLIAEIERLKFALHAVGFALGGKDLIASDVDDACVRFNAETALRYIRNTEAGLDVFGSDGQGKGE